MPKKTAAKATAQTKKRSTAKPVDTERSPRMLPLPERVWYKPQTWRRELPLPPREPLPKARLILVEVIQLIQKNWKVFGGIALIYGILSLLLVTGLSDPTNLTEVKAALNEVFVGSTGQAQTALTSFVVLVTSANSSATEASGLYQAVLLIITSLALIWAFRRAVAGETQRIRDPFYRGMYPLIPFIIILMIVSVQLIPAIVGSFIYSTVVNNGIASSMAEKAIFVAILAILSLWSLRMITTSLFAFFIVALPDMTPIKSMRSAHDLVRKRRLVIWRKLILLPIVLLLVAALIELPLILLWTPAAYWVFFLLSTAAVVLAQGYLYVLYRKLL